MNDIDPRTKFRNQLEAAISPSANCVVNHTFTLHSDIDSIKRIAGDVSVSIDFGTFLIDATHVILCPADDWQCGNIPNDMDMLEIPVKVTVTSALKFITTEIEDILGYVLKGHLNSMLKFMALIAPPANLNYNAAQHHNYAYHQRLMAQRIFEQRAAFQAHGQCPQAGHPYAQMDQMGGTYQPDMSMFQNNDLDVVAKRLRVATVLDRSETKQDELTKRTATVISYNLAGEYRTLSRAEYRPS